MAKAKEASDAKLKACQRENEATSLVLEKTFVQLAGMRTEFQEAKGSLHAQEEELRQAGEEKAKRGRELEEDELESRKRQKQDEDQVHPLIDVAEGMLWTLRQLPLSMENEQCFLADATELFNLISPVVRDSEMWARLYDFTQDDWEHAPDINVGYCVRAVTRMGLGPAALPCICKDKERCVVITKNEDGTVYFEDK